MKWDTLEWLVMIPFMPTIFAGIASLFLAVGLLLYRAYYFLKFGYWLSSLCETGTALVWQGANVPDLCHQFTYSWRGVNQMLHAGLRGVDASLSAGIVAVGLLLMGYAWIFGVAVIVRGFSNGR